MPEVSEEVALETAGSVLDAYEGKAGVLIHVLQDLQEEMGYLPEPALKRTAEEIDMPLAEVLRVATFYSSFSLEPMGEHLIHVCTGTACHVRGAPRILDALQRELGLSDGSQTTDDMKFTVKGVRCIGCCGLAPVITVDGNTHGRLTPDEVANILAEYE